MHGLLGLVVLSGGNSLLVVCLVTWGFRQLKVLCFGNLLPNYGEKPGGCAGQALIEYRTDS